MSNGAPSRDGDIHALAQRLCDGLRARDVVLVEDSADLGERDLHEAIVVCPELLERASDPFETLTALRRVLDTAAAVVLCAPAQGLSDPTRPSSAWTRRELCELLRHAGFEHVQVGLARPTSGPGLTALLAVCLPSDSAAARADGTAGWVYPDLPERLGGGPGVPVLLPPGRVAARICLITRQFCGDTFFGGIGRAAGMAVRALASSGAEVHVITLTYRASPEYTFAEGVHIHRVPEDPRWHAEPGMEYMAVVRWAAAAAARYSELDAEIGFDVVDVPDYHAEGLHLNLRPETLLAVTLHGSGAVVSRYNHEGALSPAVLAWQALELAVIRRADVLRAPSQLVLDETLALLGTQRPAARVVPNPFDAGQFPPRDVPDALPSVLRVGFVGRLERLKGADLAVRAIAAVARRGRPAELIIAGDSFDGFRADVVEPLIRETGVVVRWVQLAEQDVAAFLRGCDCLLLPSRYDSFPCAAIEALASGVPVITTSRSGVSERFTADEGLLALSLADEAGFAEAAADALLDDDWLLGAATRGPGRVRDVLSVERLGGELLDVYDEALRHSRPWKAAAAEADALREASRHALAHVQAGPQLDAEGTVTLAFADELMQRPDLLAAYAEAVEGGETSTLVAITDDEPGVLADAFVALLHELGLDSHGGPDIVLHGPVHDRGEALAPRLDAVLSEQRVPYALGRLPRLRANTGTATTFAALQSAA